MATNIITNVFDFIAAHLRVREVNPVGGPEEVLRTAYGVLSTSSVPLRGARPGRARPNPSSRRVAFPVSEPGHRTPAVRDAAEHDEGSCGLGKPVRTGKLL